MTFHLVDPSVIARPILGMHVIPQIPGDEHYPDKPNTALVDEKHGRIYVRVDEKERIFEQLRRVSANETPFDR